MIPIARRQSIRRARRAAAPGNEPWPMTLTHAQSTGTPIDWSDPPATENAIEARGLRKVYRGQHGQPPKLALNNIDLAIPRGSIFGLLGPNGAGKSTFINILAGLVVKTDGALRIWGFDPDRNPRQARASIGVVPQELNIDPFFTPHEILEFQAGMYGVRKGRRRTDEILAALGLTDKRDAYARTMSGGMRRRLLIAKAMVHDPPVLVLDEPTAGVDIELRQQLWSYVQALNARGATIVLTTHYLEEAEQLCDRIAIINRGIVAACDTKANLLRRIDSKALVITPERALHAVPPTLQALGAELHADGRLVLSYAPSQQAVEGLLTKVREAGIAIHDLSTDEPDLGDIFLNLVSASA
jgi:ABC-2 type transport system ATP-binding protein